MHVHPNPLKRAVLGGTVAASLSVNRWRGSDIAEVARLAGFEWLFIDMEHGTISEDAAAAVALLALRVGVAPIARVGTDQWYQASRLLDAGCQGIVFPHCDDARQAKAAVDAVKYPPVGKRSLTSPLPQLAFEPGANPKAMAALNDETLAIVMIETETAVKNIDQILAVDGLDGILVGTNDLAADFGIPGQLDDPKIVACYEAIGKACKARKKFFGMGGVYTAPLIKRYIGLGVQFLLGASDVGVLIAGAKAKRAEIAGLS